MLRKTWWIRTHAVYERAEAERRKKRIKVLKSLDKPLVERMANGLKAAIALMDAKKYADAREFVADFLEKNPKHAAGHALLIRIHGRLGEAGLSEHLFNYCRRAGMDCNDIYCAMVDVYASCGEFQKALEIIVEAARKGMDDVRSYINFMSGLYSHAKYREMEVFYLAIPRKYRETPAIKVKYADALRKLKRYGEAVEIATLAMGMRGTLGDKTIAKIIIAYSEMERGNPAKAYEVLNEVYERISMREDGGANFRFFPRLLCGMAFACRDGGIPQPDQTIDHWRGMLETILGEGRGKASDVVDALKCLPCIPAPAARQAVI